MDPFEEFEFKPLTDGLGFHKKKNSTLAVPASPLESREPFPKVLKDKGLELLDETSSNPLRSPLPRKNRSATSPVSEMPLEPTSDSSAAVNEILKTLQKSKRFEIENEKAKVMATPAKETYKASYWSFSAALLDGMLVTAAGILCMIVLLVVTKADLLGNFANPDADGMIYLSTAAIFALVCFIYLVINRIFVGSTPGEWAFDQRMGRPEELNTVAYSGRILLRTGVILATGIITLPLLSWLLQKDLAGQISGVQLYKKN